MKKNSFLLIFFLCFQIFAYESYENKTVSKIQISVQNQKGATSIDTSKYLSRLKTAANGPFAQGNFDDDLKYLAEDFDRIEPEFTIKNDDLEIDIKVWLRPTIRSITFEGNRQFSTKKLVKELGIKIPSIYNRQEFNNALGKIKELYIKNGYFETQINYSLNELPAQNDVDVLITVKEGRSGRIKEIKLVGFTSEEHSHICNMIYSKKHNKFLSWLTGSGLYQQEAIEQDETTIVNYLQNKGYADAKVQIKLLNDKKSDQIIVVITATKGKLYHFGKISFDGNILLTDDEIRSHITIYPGDVYSADHIRDASQNIKDAYGHRGYIDTQVYFDTYLRERDPICDVDYQIDEGLKYKVGLIKISGNIRTNSKIVLRESKLVPGETFDSQKLRDAQMRLEGLGFFKVVNVYAIQSRDNLKLDDNYRDINIDVEEENTGHVSLSSGFSSTENVFVGLEMSETNFNYRGLADILKEGVSNLRGGGEILQVNATVGAREQNYKMAWLTPYFHDTKWRFGFDVSATFSKLQSKNFDIYTQGLSIFASYPITNFFSAGGKYRVRNTINTIKDLPDQNPEKREEGIISAISGSVVYDSTDSQYKSHRGLRSIFETEFIGVGGSFHYMKYTYLNSYYYPLWRSGTLKYRWDMRFIQTINSLTNRSVPLSERFFLGGETTLRGYKPYSIGPVISGTNDPKGGVSSFYVSMEYDQEILPIFDLFCFFDAGSVAYQTFKIKRLNASVGLGIRLQVMSRIPMLVGWGLPINPDRHGDRQNLFFSMAGQF